MATRANCITWNYAVCTQYVRIDTWQLYRIHFAWCRYCYMEITHQMDELYVTVSTWWSYSKCTVCMLQVWVHDTCVICTIACYGNGTIIFLIVTVNMEYYIIVLITRNFVFRDQSFLYGFRFFSFLLSYLQFEFLSMSADLLRCWVSQFAALLQLPLQASTLYLDCSSNLSLGPTYL